MPPTTKPTRRTTRTKAATATNNPSTKQTLHGPPSAKQPSMAPPATEDGRTNCMRIVNLSLQTLSAVAQSGRKITPEETKNARSMNTDASKVVDATRTAKKALQKLRELTPADLDVERAACSITGKLITLELYEEAIQFLDGMYPRLLGIATTAQSASGNPSPLHLLSLPRPTSDDSTVLTLLMTSVTHALNALLCLLSRPSPPFSASALVTALERSHSLLAWAPTVKQDNIPEKTRDALLTKAYTFINKACTALSSSNSSGADSESVFHLRMYALACLLYTTPGTIKSATFWDQIHKTCLSYTRTFSPEPAGEERESTLAARVSRKLDGIVNLAQSLHDCSFLEGRSFVQMCETWMSFAQKGDMSMLDHISVLMGIPCPSSSSRSRLDADVPTSRLVPLSSACSVDALADRIGGLQLSDSADANGAKSTSCHSTKDAVLVECAQCCGMFVKATASLDSEGPDLARHVKEATEAVRRYQRLVANLDACIHSVDPSQPMAPSLGRPDFTSPLTDPELLRARGKLERALERLRRAGLRVLDAPQVQNQDSQHAATSLLEAIVVAFESALTQNATRPQQRTETRSMLTSLVDVFFALARSRLQPADVESYTPALSYLERAVVAVDSSLAGVITPDDAATLLRCISGTLHNLGGTLYAAGRFGGAARFLREGCVLGRRVLVMYGSTFIGDGQDNKSDREKEGRRQLEEQLFRRYELLGVCHSKIGNRKLAYDCFVDSVRTFPYTHHPAGFSCADPFAAGAPFALKQLSSIVERLTYAATCELFLPPAQIVLGRLLHASEADSDAEQASRYPPISTFPSEDGRSRMEIAGAILTRQLATLESIGHKDGAREAIGRVLEDLLVVYDPGWAPVRRARVLVAALGVCWRDPDGSMTRLDVDEIGREALALLAQETLESEEESVTRLIPELRVSVNMWMALHAYRRSPDAGTEMMSAVATHVEEAYDVLCGLLPGSAHKTVGLGLGGKPATGTKAVRGASTTTKKARSATVNKSAKGGKKAGSVVVDATAKSQGRQVFRAVSLNAAEPAARNAPPVVEKASVILDLQPILGLIQMNVHLLGLLGLIVLKVKFLEVLKRICECQTPNQAQAYSIVCVDLAYEYVKLGKSKRANALFNKCANVLKVGEEGEGRGEMPDEVKLQYLLGRAEVLALGGNISASANAYHDAQNLEATVALEDKDKTMPTAKRIRARVERLERAALACRVFAAVQHAKDNVVGALCSMLQSLRLWNRAVDALARLAPPPTNGKSTAPDQDANPFEVAPNDGQRREAEDRSPPLGTKPVSASTPTPTDALSWRLLSHLVSTLFGLAHAYHVRGSPREALYFAQQVHDLAESARAPAVMARACVVRGEVLLGQGALREAREALERAAEVIGGVVGVDAADAQRLRGDYGVLCEEEERATGDPKEHYERAWQMLDELERRIASFDGGRRRSSLEPLPMGVVVSGGQGMVVPRLLSAILRRHIWLLRDDGSDILKDLVERLMALPPSSEIKGEEHAIMGKLTLHSVYERFRSDMFLSSLVESAIALPMGMLGDRAAPSLVPAIQDILSALDDADKLFWADLALTSRSGAVQHVREASVSLAMIRALQSSLGRVSVDAPLLAVRLLDASSAITLHREMLEAIPYKIGDMHVDDLRWPLMTTDGSPLPIAAEDMHTRETVSLDDRQRTYWSALEKKYSSLVLSPTALLETTPKLPRHWTVVHITLTPDKSSMFLSRLHMETSSQPVLFCVPLRGRRDGEEDEEGQSRLTLEDALHELGEIVRLSDEGTRRAADIRNDDAQARAGWWAERAALDKRMQTLLESIEFCWLGAFKTILSPPTTLTSALIEDLRARLERVFKRSLGPQDKKRRSVKLNDGLLACFSALSPKCGDEELEDVVYFVLDVCQFHGAPIAISEVDMDQVTVDLRAALEEHAKAKKRAGVDVIEDSHTFLVLDRSLQSIPWESLPVLRGQSVSRIPSMSFLTDRVRLGEMTGEVDRVRVDVRKTYYVLNPSGDLKGTEGRFSAWLGEMHAVGWEGIVGRAPSEQEMVNALSRKDLVIYFGHGGGEQYVRSHKIRHLPRCAATMLWGCSSGALREMGAYDRVGTPYNYMVAGCPTLVANLWDVTDRDIDRLTAGVFGQLDMRGGGGAVSVVGAVARARETCRLRYLTGAAPVVYGVPFYL